MITHPTRPCRRGIIILELFSGYASHGQTIQNILEQYCFWARDSKTDQPLLIPDVQLLTLDRDFTPPEAAKRPTHFRVDALGLTAANIKLLLELYEEKEFIILASPPCQNYSTMNSLFHKKPLSVRKRLLRQSDALVKVVKTIHDAILAADRRVVTILDNPASGRLKDRAVIKWINTFHFDVDYCQYRGAIKKKTRFWTSIDLTQYGFTPEICPGWPGCKAMMPPKEDPKRQATHVEYETGPIKSSHKRSRIPELLSHKIGQALVTFYESHRKTYEANMVRTRPLVGHDPEPEKILRKKN